MPKVKSFQDIAKEAGLKREKWLVGQQKKANKSFERVRKGAVKDLDR